MVGEGSELKVSGSELGEMYKAAKYYAQLSKKKEFDICNPKDSRRKIVHILNTTGDKKAAKEEIESFLDLMMHSCQVGAAKGAMTVGESISEPKKPKKKKRAMTGWVCYLKTCAKQGEMNYMDCMKDGERKKAEYEPKKEYWKEQAEKGCSS